MKKPFNHTIKFEYVDGGVANVTGHPPTAAVRALPQWFKNIPKFENNKRESDGAGGLNLTIKACPPFLDSMLSGYVIYSEFDLLFSSKDGEPFVEWKAGGELISPHAKTQISPQQVPEGFSDQPLKFINFYRITTPKGYSSLFVHPLNRDELPFRTISGIVDTDTYPNIINFPFLVRQGFEGVVEAGTPLVQIFPFKREKWTMSLDTVSSQSINEAKLKLTHKLMSGYKSQWWHKKDYK